MIKCEKGKNDLDLTTADHIVLGESCKYRNNHRCAIVVPNLATHWIQSCSCRTKLLRKHKEEPDWKLKVICTDNSLEFFPFFPHYKNGSQSVTSHCSTSLKEREPRLAYSSATHAQNPACRWGSPIASMTVEQVQQ